MIICMSVALGVLVLAELGAKGGRLGGKVLGGVGLAHGHSMKVGSMLFVAPLLLGMVDLRSRK